MNTSGYSALVVITPGHASRVIHAAKKHGIRGATVTLGRGTAHSRLLNFLELGDTQREIVIMVTGTLTATMAMKALCDELRLEKKGHGIAIIIPLDNVFGLSYMPSGEPIAQEEESFMHKAIFTIVERGQAEAVMEAATAAGARGGTIINARGSGIHETSKLFAMEIEPEKEIVMIIAEKAQADAITSAIRESMRIDEPGRGIIFTAPVSHACGLY
ncbi:MAG: P-II family nitrogen regulator [Christensenellales bacterium]|jgi:nitrogen regulatory protein PII